MLLVVYLLQVLHCVKEAILPVVRQVSQSGISKQVHLDRWCAAHVVDYQRGFIPAAHSSKAGVIRQNFVQDLPEKMQAPHAGSDHTASPLIGASIICMTLTAYELELQAKFQAHKLPPHAWGWTSGLEQPETVTRVAHQLDHVISRLHGSLLSPGLAMSAHADLNFAQSQPAPCAHQPVTGASLFVMNHSAFSELLLSRGHIQDHVPAYVSVHAEHSRLDTTYEEISQPADAE